MNFFTEWLAQQSLFEIVGTLTALLCVSLAALNSIWNWPVAIVSVIIFGFTDFETKLYADMVLQIYFLGMNIYGWINWSRKPATGIKKPILRIKTKEWAYSILSVILFTAIIGLILKINTDASLPFVDSFCTAVSLVAQVFLARKVLENWLMWIFVDIIYVPVHIIKGLDMYAFIYCMYVFIAIYAYFDWKKDYQKQQASVL